MSRFTASFTDLSYNEVSRPFDLEFAQRNYSKSVIGGCDKAQILVYGPGASLWQLLGWLSYNVEIRNEFGGLCWWGKIYSVRLQFAGISVGLSLDKMINAISILYSYEQDGTTYSGTTPWATNQESIDRYGQKEMVSSQTFANGGLATAKRDSIINTAAFPLTDVSIGQSGDVSATLECVGYWQTLGWRYYSQAIGIEQHTASNKIADQHMGQGFSGADRVGFHINGKISDIDGRFKDFAKDAYINIASAESNNGNHLVTDVDSAEVRTYTSTTISWDANDDLHDATNGDLGFLQQDDFFRCTACPNPSNIRNWLVYQPGGEHVLVRPKTVAGVSAGSTETIVRGNYVQTSSTLATTYPTSGYTVTVRAHGERILQTFSVATAGAWALDRISVNIRKQGNPTDNVDMRLYEYTSGGLGQLLALSSMDDEAIGQNSAPVSFPFLRSVNLEYGRTYAIDIRRSGANDYDDFYVVEVDEAAGYARGDLYLWDGSAYQARYIDASLIFSVQAAWSTTWQIHVLVNRIGQFFSGTDIKTDSNVFTNPWRDGKSTGLDEAEELLQAGTLDGRKLMAEVTPERVLRIEHRPGRPAGSGDSGYRLHTSGNLYDIAGFPIEPGILPVGSWVELTEIPPATAALTNLSPFFCTRAQYDCESDQMTIEPDDSPWDIGSVIDG